MPPKLFMLCVYLLLSDLECSYRMTDRVIALDMIQTSVTFKK